MPLLVEVLVVEDEAEAAADELVEMEGRVAGFEPRTLPAPWKEDVLVEATAFEVEESPPREVGAGRVRARSEAAQEGRPPTRESSAGTTAKME